MSMDKASSYLIWLAEHTRANNQGVLEWVNDGRSKKIHGELHQLVKDEDKGAPQTQEEMLLHVFGSKSGYTRGEGSGYGGSIRSRIQEEQQQKIIQQQVTIDDQQNKISSLQSQVDELKEKMLEMSQMMPINMKRTMEIKAMSRSKLAAVGEAGDQLDILDEIPLASLKVSNINWTL